MTEPLDEVYLKWLYSQVVATRTKNPTRAYWRLLRQLFKTEFVWIISNDDNRVEDGRELRIEFLRDTGIEVTEEWMELGCSFLEMLIALSRHIAFEVEGTDKEGTPKYWFWEMLKNIGLKDCRDSVDISELRIAEIVNAVIYRTYAPNGKGGLFPRCNADQDQRTVELWYQLQGYLLDDQE